jgi:hypothetical protein
MVVDFWTVAVEQRSSGWGLARNLQEGCHISTNRSQQGLDVWACAKVIAPVE